MTNKIYIGVTKNFYKRWSEHHTIARGGKEQYKDKYQAIHAAITKYGYKNFIIEILNTFDNRAECLKAEADAVLYNKQNNIGNYNIAAGGAGGPPGGSGMLGKKHSEESKQKMSQSHLGKVISFVTRKRQSLANIGKHKTNRRTYAGVNNPAAKLTEEDINKIYVLLDEKVKVKEIATTFNVSNITIYNYKKKIKNK